MQDPFEPQKTAPPPPRQPRSRVGWIVAGIAAIGLAAGAYFLVRHSARTPPPQQTAGDATASGAPPASLSAAPADLPPLHDIDALVRELVWTVAAHPVTAEWLTTTDLLRRFTVIVEQVSRGAVPAAQLRRLRPAARFETTPRGGALVIAPSSFERFNGIADAVDAIDAAGAARVYARLRPRIDEAYRELGRSEPFDVLLERAILLLLRTPVPDSSVPVEPSGAVYVYADAGLEQLAPVQKQLLRTGPRNVRLIQAKLRQIALALGIPAERLPRQP